jgi:hypothetical protein
MLGAQCGEVRGSQAAVLVAFLRGRVFDPAHPAAAADLTINAEYLLTVQVGRPLAPVNLGYSRQGQEFSNHAAELRKHPQVTLGPHLWGAGHIKRLRRSAECAVKIVTNRGLTQGHCPSRP